jgi:hypothetical protein
MPAFIESFEGEVFGDCWYSSEVTFESGSKLAQSRRAAFVNWRSLTSICLPAQVQYILDLCCCGCDSLAEVTFEPGSTLVQICDAAYSLCSCLRSIVFQSHVEIVTFAALEDCNSLTQLAFEMPTQMRELDLPPSDFCSLMIPNSVEVVTGMIERLAGQCRLLQFSEESQLSEIDLLTVKLSSSIPQTDSRGNKGLVRLSEEVLRRFRSKFEALWLLRRAESRNWLNRNSRVLAFIMIIGMLRCSCSWSRCKCNHSQFSPNIPIYLVHGVSGSGINSLLILRLFSCFYLILISIFHVTTHQDSFFKLTNCHINLFGIQYVFPISSFLIFLSLTHFDLPTHDASGLFRGIELLDNCAHSARCPYVVLSQISILGWFRPSGLGSFCAPSQRLMNNQICLMKYDCDMSLIIKCQMSEQIQDWCARYQIKLI